jgi:hypothetical protein
LNLIHPTTKGVDLGGPSGAFNFTVNDSALRALTKV